jgi:serine/threonine protein phosphatase PrpC
MVDDHDRDAPFRAASGNEGNGDVADGGHDGSAIWGYCSESGGMREHNEDCIGLDRPHADDGARSIFVVADGMGGHAVGEVASRTAVDALLASWRSNLRGDAGKTMRASMRVANTAVFDGSAAPGRAGMGTTMTALTLGESEAIVGHVGDSRAYHLSAGSCVQLTTDHTRVEELLRMRLITPAQAVHHPARSQLTRSLGADPLVQIDIVRCRFEPGDCFVLCSDGMWDEVGGPDMTAMWAGHDIDDDAGRRLAGQLVALAIDRGSADNVSAMVVIAHPERPTGSRRDGRTLFRRGRS